MPAGEDGMPGPGRAARAVARVEGRVQGVGFRAAALGLAGWAVNLAGGPVEVVAQGPAPACRELLDWLGGGGPPGRVARVTARREPGDDGPGPAGAAGEPARRPPGRPGGGCRHGAAARAPPARRARPPAGRAGHSSGARPLRTATSCRLVAR
jgi:acylphosphatase